jgi:hypothetical protein
MSKRRTHSPEFKARVAIEAISGRKTLKEIAADHAVHNPGEPVEEAAAGGGSELPAGEISQAIQTTVHRSRGDRD